MNPTPKYIQDALAKEEANFSLVFPRLVNWKEGKDPKKPDTIGVDDNAINSLCSKAEKKLSKAKGALKKVHEHQSEYLKTAENSHEIEGTLTSPFITGLGAGHPTETGMILDRNTGVPYIPASSIKGVLRTAYAVNIADKEGIASDEKIGEIFGHDDKSDEKSFSRAKVIFLDAYPKEIPTIQEDILNPHYGNYYGGGDTLPMEKADPIPVKFLSIKPGCTFVFRYVLDESIPAEVIEKAFATAFSIVGFGGKTSIGYGRFENALLKAKKAEADKAAKLKEASEKLQASISDSVLKFEEKNKVIGTVTSSKPLQVEVTYINKKTNSQVIEKILASGRSNLQLNQKVVVSAKEWSKKNGNITMLFVEDVLQ